VRSTLSKRTCNLPQPLSAPPVLSPVPSTRSLAINSVSSRCSATTGSTFLKPAEHLFVSIRSYPWRPVCPMVSGSWLPTPHYISYYPVPHHRTYLKALPISLLAPYTWPYPTRRLVTPSIWWWWTGFSHRFDGRVDRGHYLRNVISCRSGGRSWRLSFFRICCTGIPPRRLCSASVALFSPCAFVFKGLQKLGAELSPEVSVLGVRLPCFDANVTRF